MDDIASELIAQLSNQKFMCKLCGKYSISVGHIRRHMIIHAGRTRYSCKLCTLQFVLHSALHTHLLLHNSDSVHKCEVCGKELHQRDRRKRPVVVSVEEKIYECSVCYRRYKNHTTLVRHLAVHNTEIGYGCGECRKQFSDKASFVAHVQGKECVTKYEHGYSRLGVRTELTNNSDDSCVLGIDCAMTYEDSDSKEDSHLQEIKSICEQDDSKDAIKSELTISNDDSHLQEIESTHKQDDSKDVIKAELTNSSDDRVQHWNSCHVMQETPVGTISKRIESNQHTIFVPVEECHNPVREICDGEATDPLASYADFCESKEFEETSCNKSGESSDVHRVVKQ